MLSSIVCALGVSAQTYLEHLQSKEAGKGHVVVVESTAIDSLVNGTAQKEAAAKAQATATDKGAKPNGGHETAQRKPANEGNSATDASSTATSGHASKTMHKVTGYRVQVFAGGNSRNDKNKATSIGNQIKACFPDQPVYVHFYSPRWICRMGNFRTYEEAEEMLKKVREAGYRQASLVKGKITVEY